MQTTVSNHIATLTFGAPERANALDEAAWAAMRKAFHEADVNPDVHVIVLAGEGKHFCAGMDLAVLGSLQHRMADTPEETRKQLIDFIEDIQDCISAIEQCSKPVLAAIHGGCIGGGVDIVTACDIRYCTEDAYFTVKEVDFGIVADIGTLQRLPHVLHPGMVAELAFTGRKMYGPEASAQGMVNRTFADREALMAGVMEIAVAIAAKSPRVIAGIKHNLLYKREHSTMESLGYVARFSAELLLG
ncbi:enoyl-CoA hydratase-related protein [Neolewinella persica]|uniref:enoyl-CoA hydratase-related protein n=1 Tax=Neolewinella persica TaxID=70998 RepID=UPI00036C37FA|nr:enoyl-CoA hydratase-related protein [Neolewinella persica]